MSTQLFPNALRINDLQARIETTRKSLHVQHRPKTVVFYQDDSFAFEIDENGHEIARMKSNDRLRDAFTTIEKQRQELTCLEESKRSLQKSLQEVKNVNHQLQQDTAKIKEKLLSTELTCINFKNKLNAVLQLIQQNQLYDEVIKQLQNCPQMTHAQEICYRVIQIPIEKEVIVQVPVERIKTVQIQVQVPVEVVREVPIYIERVIQVEKPIIVQKVIEVLAPSVEVEPTIIYVQRVKEVPVEVEKVVEVIKQIEVAVEVQRIVEKIVQIQRIVQVQRIVEVEIEKLIQVQVQKIVEVPIDRVIEKIVYKEVPVQRIITVERIIEVQKEIPVEVIIERVKQVQIEVIVEKIIEIPVEKVVEVERLVQVQKTTEVEVPIYIERTVELQPNVQEINQLKSQISSLYQQSQQQAQEIQGLKLLLEAESTLNQENSSIIVKLNQQLLQQSTSSSSLTDRSNYNQIVETQVINEETNNDVNSVNEHSLNRIKILAKHSFHQLPQTLKNSLQEVSDPRLADKISSIFQQLLQKSLEQQRINTKLEQMLIQLDANHDSSSTLSLLLQSLAQKQNLLKEMSLLKRENNQMHGQLENLESSNETQHLIQNLTEQLQQERTNRCHYQSQNILLRQEIETMKQHLSKQQKKINGKFTVRQEKN